MRRARDLWRKFNVGAERYHGFSFTTECACVDSIEVNLLGGVFDWKLLLGLDARHFSPKNLIFLTFDTGMRGGRT
jgi:hypothetical protein